MKKRYERPIMIFESFMVSQDVASGCTRVSNTVTTKSWEKQTVKCIVSTYDNIFGSDNCNINGYTVIDSSVLVKYDYDNDGTIEDTEYFFVWKSSQMEGKPSNAEKAHLEALESLAGDDIYGTGNIVHAGPVNLSLIDITEYSFSY